MTDQCAKCGNKDTSILDKHGICCDCSYAEWLLEDPYEIDYDRGPNLECTGCGVPVDKPVWRENRLCWICAECLQNLK